MIRNYRYDSEIADLVYKIFNAGNFHNETFNESILIKLFELRGTPLEINKEKYCRNVEEDWKGFLEDTKLNF